MANLILAAVGVTDIAATVGATVGTQIIGQSVSMSMSGITSGIKYLFSPKKYDIKEVNDIRKLLRRLDIVADIEVVKTYLANLKTDSPAVLVAWTNLNEVMEQIYLQIEQINKKVDFVENSSRAKVWWKGYPNFKYHCEEIQELSELFNRRFDLLKKIL